MPQIETTYRSLPVATSGSARFSSFRASPRAEFLSQLIAERDNLPAQRVKRQATPLEVLRTYDKGGKLKVMRMPPGYGLDLTA